MTATQEVTPSKTLMDLETKFWQSMVDEDTEAALAMLNEPALMVSAHGSMKFDHEGYRKMAVVTYRVKQSVAMRGTGKKSVQQMNDTSTWVQAGTRWKCLMHTETPAKGE